MQSHSGKAHGIGSAKTVRHFHFTVFFFNTMPDVQSLPERLTGNGQKIAYQYDVNGNLIEKMLGDENCGSAQKLPGSLTDTYRYDALGNLSGYAGYDGFEQTYATHMVGVRTEKRAKGDPNRLTLEEMLEGKTLADKEQIVGFDSSKWETTRYLQDLTAPYAQVMAEITERNGQVLETTTYAYGLERLSKVTEGSRVGRTEEAGRAGQIGQLGRSGEADNTVLSTLKTAYVYDARGSVAQMLDVSGMVNTPQTLDMQALNAQAIKSQAVIASLRYTPFGQQINKVQNGYSYNAENYDAATGMLHLRARQYEPAMMRFNQKDLLRGNTMEPLSLNRYAFVLNNPIMFADPSGEVAVLVGFAAIAAASVAAANTVNKTTTPAPPKTTTTSSTSNVANTVARTAGVGVAVGVAAGTNVKATSNVVSTVSNSVASATRYVVNAVTGVANWVNNKIIEPVRRFFDKSVLDHGKTLVNINPATKSHPVYKQMSN